MTWHQITVVFDAYLSFDGRCRKVTNLRNDRTCKANQTAQQQYIHIIHGVSFIDPYAIQQTQHDGCDDTAYRTFNGFLGAQYRAEFIFTQEVTCKIRTCITAKGRNKCQPNQQFTVIKFSYQIYMGKQEAGIEEAKQRCYDFYII